MHRVGGNGGHPVSCAVPVRNTWPNLLATHSAATSLMDRDAPACCLLHVGLPERSIPCQQNVAAKVVALSPRTPVRQSIKPPQQLCSRVPDCAPKPRHIAVNWAVNSKPIVSHLALRVGHLILEPRTDAVSERRSIWSLLQVGAEKSR